MGDLLDRICRALDQIATATLVNNRNIKIPKPQQQPPAQGK